ncbi:Peroxisomal sarcosine oxidase [Euphorbia peplus]|nr:Peroxisomal sarcosine oxidase [Euphorbia peplus]
MANSGEEYDVIVVGAGIMGSSTAYQVSKRGKKVLLLEQFDFLHSRGSSHGETRTLRSVYAEDYYTAMTVESSLLWEETQAEIGFDVYYKAPHLDIGPSDDKLFRSVISSCRKSSIPHQFLDPNQLSEKFSGKINVPEGWIGVYTEFGGVIKPTKAVSMYQQLASRNGAVLKDNTEVNAIVNAGEKGGVFVETTKGEKFWGGKCVITAGAWVKKLVKTVSSVEVPVEVMETAAVYWRIKEGYESDFTIESGFPTFSSFGVPHLYGTPTFEFPGLIKVAGHGVYTCDPDKRPWTTGFPLDEIRKWIKETFGGFVDDSGPATAQMCMYSMTPDEDFVLDFLSGGGFGKDVVVGGGFSGHGFKMAPIVGRILADLALNGETKVVDMKYFKIDRFQNDPKGNSKEYEE